MHLPFFISLATALVAIYIAKNSADEISYLATAIVVVSLVLTLIFAPWQLQILLLISIWFSKKLFFPFTRSTVESQSNQKVESDLEKQIAIAQPRSIQIQITKLAYRGVSYQSDSPIQPEVKGKIIGKYRGLVCQTSQLENPPAQASNLNLKYRGACINPTPSVAEASPTTPKVRIGIKTATRKVGSRGIVLVRPVLSPNQN
ncbi:MAG: DUF4278 domain-containing protein [Cyanosarcina radialis HA8281-LM2]|jgi:membrane protein implicated in regulation of membrane protease activity|nr:DUF4278 domain-containing protein [Cyanosarcina radialis HA8281-LM2]